MASGQTSNYGLNQWAAEDKVLREEFNQDNAKIDEAMHELQANVMRTAVGSYVGSGQHGSSAPNHLEFDFVPKVIIIVADEKNIMENGTVLITGQRNSAGIGTAYSGSNCLNLSISWAGTGLSWYSLNASSQLNEADTTYFYFALG